MFKGTCVSVFIATLAISGCMSGSVSATIPSGYQIEKTVIFSRHGIRAPLIGYGSVLAESTPKQWPEWQTKGGMLTPKGATLEQHFGRYLADQFIKQGLLPKGQCPAEQVLIYTNSLPRTIDTGESLARGAFPDCKLEVHHIEAVGKMDNTFNPIIRDEVTEQFTSDALKSIDGMLGNGGFAGLNQILAPNYAVLEKVLDYSQSPLCLQKQHCKFGSDDNTLKFEKGKEPKTTGALRNGTGAADSFVLQYYEGFAPKDVAWGANLTADEWQKIAAIKDRYGEVLFASPVIAKQAAMPLLKFIETSFVNNDYQHPLADASRKAKVTFLVGHDSNAASLLSLLKIKDYQLPHQYEKTPISGKIVFEKWRDAQGKALMKIRYLYQGTEQLREGKPLGDTNLPYSVTLEMEGCPIDANGFCPMAQFEQAVQTISQ